MCAKCSDLRKKKREQHYNRAVLLYVKQLTCPSFVSAYIFFTHSNKYFLMIRKFQANAAILKSLKTRENQTFSGIFKGYKMGTLAGSGLSVENEKKSVVHLHQLFHQARTTADQHYYLLSMGTKNKTQQFNYNMLESCNLQTYVTSLV